MAISALMCYRVVALSKAFGVWVVLAVIPACPFGRLAGMGFGGDSVLERIARAMLVFVPWPAYGLAMTWAGWRGDRERMALTATVLVRVHAAAIIATIVLMLVHINGIAAAL